MQLQIFLSQCQIHPHPETLPLVIPFSLDNMGDIKRIERLSMSTKKYQISIYSVRRFTEGVFPYNVLPNDLSPVRGPVLARWPQSVRLHLVKKAQFSQTINSISICLDKASIRFKMVQSNLPIETRGIGNELIRQWD